MTQLTPHSLPRHGVVRRLTLAASATAGLLGAQAPSPVPVDPPKPAAHAAARVPVFWLLGQSSANGSWSGFWLSNPLNPQNLWPHLADQPDVKIWWPGASAARPTSVPAWEGYRVGSPQPINNGSYYIWENHFGTECAFGNAAVAVSGGPVYVFKYAEVSSLNPRAAVSWSKSAPPGNLYDSLLSEWAKAKAALAAKNLEPDLAGIYWFQGQGDAFAPPPNTLLYAQEYETHLRRFIADLRADLAPADSEARPIPFVIVQFHHRHEPRAQWQPSEELIRSAQERIAEDDPHVGLCFTDRFGLDPQSPNLVHYLPDATVELGFAMFETWLFDLATPMAEQGR